jgi:hypothetical protein
LKPERISTRDFFFCFYVTCRNKEYVYIFNTRNNTRNKFDNRLGPTPGTSWASLGGTGRLGRGEIEDTYSGTNFLVSVRYF